MIFSLPKSILVSGVSRVLRGRGLFTVKSRGSGCGGVAGTLGACSKAAFVAQADYFNMLHINVNNKYLKVFYSCLAQD